MTSWRNVLNFKLSTGLVLILPHQLLNALQLNIIGWLNGLYHEEMWKYFPYASGKEISHIAAVLEILIILLQTG